MPNDLWVELTVTRYTLPQKHLVPRPYEVKFLGASAFLLPFFLLLVNFWLSGFVLVGWTGLPFWNFFFVQLSLTLFAEALCWRGVQGVAMPERLINTVLSTFL
jgi:hypothetical protein